MLTERHLDGLEGLPPLLAHEQYTLPGSIAVATKKYGGAAFVVPERVMVALCERITELRAYAEQQALMIEASDKSNMSAVEQAEAEVLQAGWS